MQHMVTNLYEVWDMLKYCRDFYESKINIKLLMWNSYNLLNVQMSVWIPLNIQFISWKRDKNYLHDVIFNIKFPPFETEYYFYLLHCE